MPASARVIGAFLKTRVLPQPDFYFLYQGQEEASPIQPSPFAPPSFAQLHKEIENEVPTLRLAGAAHAS